MRRTLIVGLVAVLATGAFTGPAGAGERQRIFGVQDCTKPKVKPTRIVFACADFGLYANDFDWKHWGHRKARTSGVIHAKGCNPSCVEDPGFHDYPVKLVLRRIKMVSCGGRSLRMYTKVKLSFPGPKPPRVEAGSQPHFCF